MPTQGESTWRLVAEEDRPDLAWLPVVVVVSAPVAVGVVRSVARLRARRG